MTAGVILIVGTIVALAIATSYLFIKTANYIESIAEDLEED